MIGRCLSKAIRIVVDIHMQPNNDAAMPMMLDISENLHRNALDFAPHIERSLNSADIEFIAVVLEPRSRLSGAAAFCLHAGNVVPIAWSGRGIAVADVRSVEGAA